MRCAPVIVPKGSIMFVGEAPGKDEEELGRPFIGKAGQELNRMLKTVGIDRALCSVSNVFMDRPKNNDIEEFFTSKKLGAPGIPQFRPGKYITVEKVGELNRLREEIIQASPNLVVALGGPACWALLGQSKISKYRGFCANSSLVPGQKVLPTFHPAAVMRQWELRSVVLIDLIKARMESQFPEIQRPRREIWIEPTLDDLELFYDLYLKNAEIIGLDVETKARKQITCISFSPDKEHSLVIPFLDTRQVDWSYWRTLEDEVRAWKFVKRILEEHSAKKIGHNGLYDIQYLWWGYGIKVKNYSGDTMLLHHSIQPELQKSLEFLGSIYTNEVAWKDMRKEKDSEKPND